MRTQVLIRALLFAVFFAVGAAVFSISVLSNDLLGYCRNKQLLGIAEESTEQLKALDGDYSALLERLQAEPDIIRHIAPATLGAAPADANAVYPTASAQQLADLRKALEDRESGGAVRPQLPSWLVWCSSRTGRLILFLFGGFLIVVSFVWFGSPARPAAPA